MKDEKKNFFSFISFFSVVSNRINRLLCITSQRQRTEKADVIAKNVPYKRRLLHFDNILYPDRIIIRRIVFVGS